jgi:antitoxin component YwqK of YwqJK toxin-antitoxin module
VLPVTLWAIWQAPLEGYGILPSGSAYSDELLGNDLLALTDWELGSRTSARGKESSQDVMIDGRTGTLSRGWYTSGKLEYEETWLDGKQHGRESWWNDKGQKIEESHWKTGFLNGWDRRWFPDGQLAEEAFYDRFRLHGTFRTWHRNGQQTSEAQYRAGLREGLFRAWYPTGAVHCEASFRNDRLHGTWRKWDVDGKLVKQVEYRHGSIISQTPGWRREPFVCAGPLGARDFAFVLAQGSSWHGFHTLRVSAAGRCEFRYFFRSKQVSTGDGRIGLQEGEIYTTNIWRQGEFQLTDKMQQHLRDILQAADLFGMKDHYINEQIADGRQWVVRLRADGREKRIYCSNTFPQRLRDLSPSIRDGVMVPHKMELVTATRIEPDRKGPDEEEWPEDGR